jgi:hypothetical protein
MNNKELRLGNIVGVSFLEDRTPIKETYCIIEVVSSSIIEASVFYFGEKIGNRASYKLKECVGIPLTEDWLVKLGFEWTVELMEYIAKDISAYPASEDKFVFEIDFNDNSDCFAFRNIKYVHQLQNLYFALKGTDLILNNSTNNGNNNSLLRYS